MEQNLKERIEPNLQRHLNFKVKESEERMGFSNLDIPPETFKKLRQRFVEEQLLMYQMGKDDHHEFIKDMYRENVDALVEMCERDDDLDWENQTSNLLKRIGGTENE